MIKKINVSRIGLVSIGVFLILFFAVPVATQKAHASIVLDAPTTILLSDTLVATRSLMNTVQAGINANLYPPAKAAALSSILGGIGQTLANISAMIGGSVGLPNTGELPN